MLRHGIPPEVVTALRAVLGGLSRLGRGGRGDAAARRRRGAACCATARCGSCTGPGTARRTRSSTTSSDGVDAARRRPPDRAHLLQPAARAPARRRGRLRRAAPAGAASPTCDSLAQTREMDARRSCSPATAADRRPRRADRRALAPAPAAAREKIRRLIEAAAAHGARDRARAVGQRRRHAGLPDAVGGARARRPAARRRERRRTRERRRRALRRGLGGAGRSTRPRAAAAIERSRRCAAHGAGIGDAPTGGTAKMPAPEPPGTQPPRRFRPRLHWELAICSVQRPRARWHRRRRAAPRRTRVFAREDAAGGALVSLPALRQLAGAGAPAAAGPRAPAASARRSSCRCAASRCATRSCCA